MNGSARAAPVRALLSIGACAVALAFLVVRYADGPIQISPQGRQLLAAAHNLNEHGSLDLPRGRPLSFFPPLYSFLLAALEKIGFEPIASVVLINGCVFLGGLLAFHALAQRLEIPRPAAATAAYGMLAVHPYFFRMARPDAIVPVLTMTIVLGLLAYARRPRIASLSIVAVACALASLSRYIALFTVIPVAAFALYRWGGSMRRRHLALFALLAAGPLAAWLVRNRIVTGYLTGMSRTDLRETADRTGFVDNVMAMGKTLALDLFGWNAMGERRLLFGEAPIPHAAATLAGTIVGVVAAALLVRLARKARAVRAPAPDSDAGRGTALTLAFLTAHALALIALWSFANNDPIHTRYVAPMAWCFVALGAVAFHEARRGRRPGLAAVLAALLALLVLVPNAGKSRSLWSQSPGENLIKRSLRAPDDIWKTSLTWEEAAAPPSR